MIAVVCVAAVVLLAGAGAVPVNDADVAPTSLPSHLYEILRLVTFHTPPEEVDLVSMALACKEVRSLVHHQLGQYELRRLFFPNLGTKHFVRAIDHLPWTAPDNSPKIQLLQRLATESNQVVLARKLFYMITYPDAHLRYDFSAESSKEEWKTAGKAIQFLAVRCGYRSLAEYIFGNCMGHHDYQFVFYIDFLSEYVIPLMSLEPLQSENLLPSPIHEVLLQANNSSRLKEESRSKIRKTIPERFHPYLSDGRYATRQQLRDSPCRDIIREHPGVLRALYKVGFTFDLLDIQKWPDLTVTELRRMAPYLCMAGIGPFLARNLERNQYDLAAELLRHLPAVHDSQKWLTDRTLFQLCVLAHRCGAREALRGLLHHPMTIGWEHADQFTNYHEACLDAFLEDSLRILKRYRRKVVPAAETDPSRQDEILHEEFLVDRDGVLAALEAERLLRCSSLQQEGVYRTLQWMDSWILDANTA